MSLINMWRTRLAEVHVWFDDDIFRRLFVNAGKLVSANGLAALLSFAITAITARALGPETYGILVLVLVYVQTISILVSFNAWQAIIKFGTEAMHDKDPQRLSQLIKFGFSLDLGSACIGIILAVVLSQYVVDWLGWDSTIRPLLVIYSALILIGLNGTPIGVLRLFDRFDLLSYVPIIKNTAKFLGVVWCFMTEQTLFAFVLTYLFAEVLGYVFQIIASLVVLRRHRLGSFITQPIAGIRTRFPGIWDYIWSTNVNSTIRLLSREADELIVATMTSPTALGLYRIAKQFSRVLLMFTDPLYQSIYPELARLWTIDEKSKFASLIRRTTFLVGIIVLLGWLIFALVGQWLIAWILGPAYQDAYLVILVYMLALVIAAVTFSFQPSMLAVGLPRTSLKVLVFATCVYLFALIVLINIFGVLGASLGYVVFYVVWSLTMFFILRPYIWRVG